MIAALVDQFVLRLNESQAFSSDQLLQHQRRLLQPLLRHAASSVPFYRESNRLGVMFRPDGGIAWDRWGEIPILTRSEVRRAGSALRAEAFLGPTSSFETSGSTGEPVEVWHSELADKVVRTAVILRDCQSFGVDPTKRLLFLGVSPPAGSDATRVRTQTGWYAGLDHIGIRGERFDYVDSSSPATLIDVIADVRPDYLGAHPVTMELIAAHDRRGRVRALSLQGAIATGGGFSRDGQKDVEREFGCRVSQIYGSNECLRMARSCASCGQYHVNADIVHLEVIGGDGRHSGVGETGRVIATPLYNYAMPLIRYDHDDHAVVGRSDVCTTRLPALSLVLGKEQRPFVFPDGLTIRPKVPTAAVVKWLGARAFQIRQVASDRCELHFVPETLSSSEIRTDEMTKVLRRLWWDGLQVDYVEVNDLRSHRGGKAAPLVRGDT